MNEREQAIGLLKQCLEDWPYAATRVPTIMHRIQDAIAILEKPEVPDTNVGKWVSVKDRMPENQCTVIVYVPPYSDDEDEYTGYVGMAYYTYSANGGYWAGTDGNVYGAIGIIHKPTHWMPLPEPPMTEKEKEE